MQVILLQFIYLQRSEVLFCVCQSLYFWGIGGDISSFITPCGCFIQPFAAQTPVSFFFIFSTRGGFICNSSTVFMGICFSKRLANVLPLKIVRNIFFSNMFSYFLVKSHVPISIGVLIFKLVDILAI